MLKQLDESSLTFDWKLKVISMDPLEDSHTNILRLARLLGVNIHFVLVIQIFKVLIIL